MNGNGLFARNPSLEALPECLSPPPAPPVDSLRKKSGHELARGGRTFPAQALCVTGQGASRAESLPAPTEAVLRLVPLDAVMGLVVHAPPRGIRLEKGRTPRTFRSVCRATVEFAATGSGVTSGTVGA
uniref:Uncharacterized protein n=1 Tax=Varanus komodoensis TaxID=61221 RepID=A0A8D2LVJ7_VARKO